MGIILHGQSDVDWLTMGAWVDDISVADLGIFDISNGKIDF